jgi:hypothetical protein
MAVVALAIWVVLHMRRFRRPSVSKLVLLAGGITAGFASLSAVLRVLDRILTYTSIWPVWAIVLGAAIAVEGILALYAYERGLTSGGPRRALGWLRVALVLLVVLLLLQPVCLMEREDTLRRSVAILMDDSVSMHIADSQMTPTERLRLGVALGLTGVDRPFRFEEVARKLEAARGQVAAQADWLASLVGLKPADREEALERRRAALNSVLGKIEKDVADQAADLTAVAKASARLPPELLREAAALDAELAQRVLTPLSELVRTTSPLTTPRKWIRLLQNRKQQEAAAQRPGATAGQTNGLAAEVNAPTNVPTVVEVSLAEKYEHLRLTTPVVTAALSDLAGKINKLAGKTDAALYTGLDPETRASVDALARMKRTALARDVLLKPAARAKESFLSELKTEYLVKVYRFAASAAELDLEQWLGTITAAAPGAPGADGTGTNQPAGTKPLSPAQAPTVSSNSPAVDPKLAERVREEADYTSEQQKTDIAVALERVMADIPERQLGSVILLSDGRHNTPAALEPLARQLGLRNVPLFAVVLGAGTNPPPDSAILDVDAPEMVCLGDKVYFNVEIKLDGVTNKTVAVDLFEGGKVVASENVDVTNPLGMRSKVSLSHEPDKAGLHEYRIALNSGAGEAVVTNNAYGVSVNVSEERIKILLVEGRPSWEFRYLKNLFATRDRTAQLQYVLMEPDVIAEAPPRSKVIASAAHKREDSEATELPVDEAEWLKFDTIILGDVAPEDLGEVAQRALVKFVTARGGTLIVVAGPRHMPHEYAGTPLAGILPVKVIPSGRALTIGPEKQFRIALTAEGRASEIMRLQVQPEENLDAWKTLPDLTWRHGLLEVKEGASVLAYAMPPDPPPFMTRSTFDEDDFRRRLAFERRQALVMHHNVAMGRVMFLGFNQTWRFRYRVGDTLHHRFWGQVMRWAAADKLPFGTPFVRLGTDRSRYSPGSVVRARATIMTPGFEPIISPDVVVKVFAGDKLVLQKGMEYVPESAGVYQAMLGALANGHYRLQLESKKAEEAHGSGSLSLVKAEFSVESVVRQEWLELTPDRGLLARLAALTGGKVIDPSEIGSIREKLPPGRYTFRERKQVDVWNSWPLLVLIVCVAAAEWLIRKNQRLP